MIVKKLKEVPMAGRIKNDGTPLIPQVRPRRSPQVPKVRTPYDPVRGPEPTPARQFAADAASPKAGPRPEAPKANPTAAKAPPAESPTYHRFSSAKFESGKWGTFETLKIDRQPEAVATPATPHVAGEVSSPDSEGYHSFGSAEWKRGRAEGEDARPTPFQQRHGAPRAEAPSPGRRSQSSALAANLRAHIGASSRGSEPRPAAGVHGGDVPSFETVPDSPGDAPQRNNAARRNLAFRGERAKVPEVRVPPGQPQVLGSQAEALPSYSADDERSIRAPRAQPGGKRVPLGKLLGADSRAGPSPQRFVPGVQLNEVPSSDGRRDSRPSFGPFDTLPRQPPRNKP